MEPGISPPGDGGDQNRREGRVNAGPSFIRLLEVNSDVVVCLLDVAVVKHTDYFKRRLKSVLCRLLPAEKEK